MSVKSLSLVILIIFALLVVAKIISPKNKPSKYEIKWQPITFKNGSTASVQTRQNTNGSDSYTIRAIAVLTDPTIEKDRYYFFREMLVRNLMPFSMKNSRGEKLVSSSTSLEKRINEWFTQLVVPTIEITIKPEEELIDG